jgi:hypothetical protein
MSDQLDMGALLRDEGIARAELAAMPWGAVAFDVLVEILPSLTTLTSEDVWAELDRRGIPRPAEGRAMGAVMQRAIRAGLIVPVGFTTSTVPAHHKDPTRLYRRATASS